MNKYYPGEPADYNFRKLFKSVNTPVYDWKNVPPATSFIGEFIVRDIGVRHTRWYSDGSRLQPLEGSIELDAQMFPVTFKNDKTTNQVCYEYHIPPWLLRENWSLEVEVTCTFGAIAGGVTQALRLALGSAVMASVNNGAATTTTTTKWHGVIVNNINSVTAQMGEASGFAGVGAQQGNVAFNTTTADLRKYTALQIWGFIQTLGDGSVSSTVHSVRVRLRPGLQ